MRTSNGQSHILVTAREEFKANHIFAEHLDNGFYVVYSYGYHFPMYAYDGKVWYRNVSKYSATTSKHKSQACPDADSFFDCDTVQLQKIINGGVYTKVTA